MHLNTIQQIFFLRSWKRGGGCYSIAAFLSFDQSLLFRDGNVVHSNAITQQSMCIIHCVNCN